jgi:hypothetical protein
MMDKLGKVFIAVLLIGLLAACTNSIRTNVSRFHVLPKPSGESIVIVPMNKAYKGSLEFANYATLVGNALGNFGYVPANGEKADLIVELDYGVDQGQQTIRTSGSYGGYSRFSAFYGHGFYPRYGYHPRYYGLYGDPFYYGGYGGIYDPFGYSPLGYGPSVRTYVTYNRSLKMVIRPNRDGSQNLFEGEVTSKGKSNQLHEVMPYLVQAFFSNFPGQSGSSESISIELPKS